MIKAIIFDWFGVCSEEFRKILSRELNKKLGINKKLIVKSYKKYEPIFIISKINSENVLENMFKELGINEDANNFLYIFNSMPKINTEIFKIIRKLKNNHKTALLSDNFDEMTKTIRENLNLKKYFDFVIFSNEVGLVKTENKTYKFVIRKLKCKPSECIFIDDKKENIERARKLGIDGILFKNTNQLKKSLVRLNVKI